MIKELMQNYGEIGALGTFILLMVWYVRFQTKQQSIREANHDKIQAEDREFNRNLITGTLKEIHATGIKNSELNRKSISIQKEFATETVGTLKSLCDRMNGGTEGIRAIASLKTIDERKRKSKVKVERRK